PTLLRSLECPAMNEERIRRLNDKPTRRGRYVLYRMQRSQRSEGNLALEYAVERANEMDLPMLAAFALFERYPDANVRHFAFMLERLADVAKGLAQRGIGFAIRRGAPPDPIVDLARDASLVIFATVRYMNANGLKRKFDIDKYVERVAVL
ncbi:MAG TPA: deoxyribodipyrimidine photo-lyase, partial [Rhodothermia bacterium]